MNDDSRREDLHITGPIVFHGLIVAKYAAGHRAIIRSLTRDHPDMALDMVSWAMIYVLTRPLQELVSLSLDVKATWEKILEFANTFPPLANVEAVTLSAAILDEVNAAMFKVVEEQSEMPEKKTSANPINPPG